MIASRLLALLLCIVVAAPAAAQSRPAPGAIAATLSVLAGEVRHAPPQGSPGPAVSGMNLAAGDRVVTGPDGYALVTFLDGTTLTVQPGSDVTVTQATDGGHRAIRVLITVGTVWARLARLLAAGSSVTLESNAYAATARDGLIGAAQRADGVFVCWTRAGRLTVADTRGVPRATLEPGQRATLAAGRPAAVDPFAVNASVLEIAARGALPLVRMPDGGRVAGFVSPGIEVNQVFGSLTALRDGRHVVEVPAGQPGPYVIVLEALAGSRRFAVTVVGRYRGRAIYRRDLGGRVEPGARLQAEVAHRFAEPADPRTAELTGGTVTALRTHDGPLPGTILLAPAELDAARR